MNYINADQCEKLPVFTTPSIQGAGCVIGVRKSDLTILCYSQNCSSIFERNFSKFGAMGAAFPDLAFDFINSLKTMPEESTRYFFDLKLGTKSFDLVITADADQIVWVEFFKSSKADPLEPSDAHSTESLIDLNMAENLDEALELACQHTQSILGYSRAIVYKFLEDYHGVVVAEINKNPSWQNYLGLRFPNTDVPKVVRDGYLKHGGRWVFDRDHNDSKLLFKDSNTQKLVRNFVPVKLRSVHILHREYMDAMNVSKSCSFPIIVQGQLWGLLAAHGTELDRPSVKKFKMMEGYVRLLSSVLDRIRNQNETFALEMSSISKITIQPSQIDTLPVTDKISRHADDLLENFKADCLVVGEDGVITPFGQDLPDTKTIEDCFQFILDPSHPQADKECSTYFGEGGETFLYKGWLKISFGGEGSKIRLLFLRKEEVAAVKWAGKPSDRMPKQKPNPVSSFETWKELRKGYSAAWTDHELLLAKKLKERLQAFFDLHQEKVLSFLKGNQEASSAFLHDLSNSMQALTGYLDIMLEDFESQNFDRSLLAIKIGLGNIHSLLSESPDELSLCDICLPELEKTTRVLQYIQERIKDLDQSVVQLNEIATVCSKLICMHREMHSFKMKNFSPISIGKIENYLGLLEKAYQQYGNFHIQFLNPEGIESIFFDESKIYRILTNLIKNSLESIEKSGRTPKITCQVMGLSDQKGVQVKVTDNGIGVQDFNLSLSTKPAWFVSRAGKGVGLYSVQKMLDEVGGSISLSSTSLDLGAVATITLPQREFDGTSYPKSRVQEPTLS